MLWIQLFYWMRLFKRFSAFVRIITEIVLDIKVFFLMLFLCLCAFSNVICICPHGFAVLNINRENGGKDSVVEALVIGWNPAY